MQNGTSSRRMRAIEVVVRIESLKAQKDRDLEIESIIQRADQVDGFVRKLPSS